MSRRPSRSFSGSRETPEVAGDGRRRSRRQQGLFRRSSLVGYIGKKESELRHGDHIYKLKNVAKSAQRSKDNYFMLRYQYSHHGESEARSRSACALVAV